MKDDTISRAAALDALGEEPPVWYDGEDEIAERNQWRRDVAAIKALPSATDTNVGGNLSVDKLITFLNPESNYVFYDDSHGFCINTQDVLDHLCAMPSAQLAKDLPNTCTDAIGRQAAIDVAFDIFPDDEYFREQFVKGIEALPSAKPEPLSDAYMKAVWTWLLNYQIKAAELKGRYTPYEVLSWVANDWRKEHEGSDKQTGGD